MRRVARLNPPLTGFIVEEWRPVVSYGGFYSDYYEVSNLGRVRSLDRYTTIKPKNRKEYSKLLKGEYRKLTLINDGYLQVGLSKNGFPKSPMVHRLVAEAFLPNPDNKPFINHKNGIKTDNSVLNLEWCTHAENMKHASEYGLRPSGEDHHYSTLSNNDIVTINNLLDQNSILQKDIAKLFNVGASTISRIKLGERGDLLTNRKGKVLPNDMIGKNNPAAKRIINCRGEIFDTLKDAGKAYNISWTGISRVCRGKGQSAGTYKDGTRIKWKYYTGNT